MKAHEHGPEHESASAREPMAPDMDASPAASEPAREPEPESGGSFPHRLGRWIHPLIRIPRLSALDARSAPQPDPEPYA